MDKQQIHEMTDFFGVLADNTRLSILYLLREKEMMSKEIQDEMVKAQSTVSQHLKILKNAGLIDSRKEGAIKNYRIRDDRIFKILRTIKFYLLEKKKKLLESIEKQDVLDTLR